MLKKTLLPLFLLACLLVTSLGLTACGKDDYDDGFWLLTEDISKYIVLDEDDYKKAVLTIDAVEEITMEDVNKYIRNAQIEAYANSLVSMNTGTVQDEDTVVLWYRGEVNIGTDEAPEWVEFFGGSNYNDTVSTSGAVTAASPYSLRIGSGNFIPGFEEALIGINIAETNINVGKGANKQVGVAGEIVYITYKYTSTDTEGKVKTGTMVDRVDLRKDADGNYTGTSRYSKELRDALDGLYVKEYIKKDGQLAKFTESFDMTQDLKADSVVMSSIQVTGIVTEENIKVIDVAFPNPYSNNAELAGKKARWYVAIDEIKRLPENADSIDDIDYTFISGTLGINYQAVLNVMPADEISSIGSNTDEQKKAVVKYYKDYIFEAMKEERESKISSAIQNAFWEYIAKESADNVIKYPEELLEQYIAAMRQSAEAEFEEYSKSQGNAVISTLAQYLVNYYSSEYFPSVDKIDEGFETMAKEQLRSEMALYYIAAKERMTMTKSERDKTAEEEMKALIDYYTAYYQAMGQLSSSEAFTEQDMANAGITKRSLVENAYLNKVNAYIAETLRPYVIFKDAEAE